METKKNPTNNESLTERDRERKIRRNKSRSNENKEE